MVRKAIAILDLLPRVESAASIIAICFGKGRFREDVSADAARYA